MTSEGMFNGMSFKPKHIAADAHRRSTVRTKSSAQLRTVAICAGRQ